MTIIFELTNRRYTYRTDTTQPRERGRWIGGIAYSYEQMQAAVAKYLGHTCFTLLPNAQDKRRAENATSPERKP